TYGNAVHRARVLYSSYNPDVHFDNLEICNSQGVNKNGLSKLNQQLAGLTEYANNKNKSVVNQSEITIFPNPNDGILNIASTGATNLTIYNLLGNKVVQIPLNPKITINTIKLEHLNPGLYLIKVESSQNEIFISKLIIQQ
ncbi:MAG: T9SS type A sorting domain-containing protein, partial [Chitinophagaceae bacterium]|nr:T9SS type A sorting domain-containing protein [Chitinophagaceae bacterium]